MRKGRHQEGITLMELIIAIGILGVVLASTWPLMRFSTQAETAVRDEYQMQSDVRLASEELTSHLRKATVGFTVTNAQLSTGRTPGWDYFVLSLDKKSILYYHWQDTGGGAFAHVPTVVVPSRPRISYNLTFRQGDPGTKKIKFRLDGYYDGNTDTKTTVESEVIALNAIVIDDIGTDAVPAVALAYRDDPAPTPETVTTYANVKIAVAMVLDDSGSMGDEMGGTGSDRHSIRNTILEAKAKTMIDSFVAMGNVRVCIIPFANSADPKTMYDATEVNKATLKNQISALHANGGTNTGDGMRRAYWILKDYKDTYINANPGAQVVTYMMLLTDGNPTYYSWKSGSYQLDNTAMNTLYGSGQETTTNINNSMNYVESVGSHLITGGALDIKSFIIGFTGEPADITRVHTIAEDYCTHVTDSDRVGTYYYAGSAVELENVMTEITSTILSETWHLYGPY